MLSIRWIQSVDYYLRFATADYFFRPGEPLGRWWGSGTKALGLRGNVAAEQLEPLCQGFSPAGNALTQNAGADDHQQAWDLTFSAPKSVSVLWSQADRETRLKIQKCHEKAIQTALKYLADVAIITRRGKGGLIHERALPIVAIFGHASSRELEPDLHDHCVLVNVAARADGTFGTILSKPVFLHKMTAGALYQAQLNFLLQSELGLRTEAQETAFGVVGVPQKLVDRFSTRSKQIRNKLRSKGFHSAKAAAVAALATRKPKPNSPPPRGLLFRRWRETGSKFGFSEAEVRKLLGKVTVDTSPPMLAKQIREAVEELLESESFFSEQRLICRVARKTLGQAVPAVHIINQVRAFLLEDSGLLALGMPDHEPLYTTREMWALEQELLATIDQGKNDTSHVIKASVVERFLDEYLPLGPHLTEDEAIRNREQRAAVLNATAKPGNVQVTEGMAGTGKTYHLSVARQIWEKLGYRVEGVALSAIAAANLQEGAGIESSTIALRLLQLDGRRQLARHHKRQLKRLLKGKRTYAYDGPQFRLTRKTVLVIDEAAMVGTRQMAKLLKRARKAGAKVVLIGDRRQLQPIDAGGPFAAIADMTDKAELQHVVRQRVEPDDPNPTWHRQAGKLIAAGHIAQAIKLFKERGRFSLHDESDQATLSIVRDWSVEGIANPTDHIVLAGTRAKVAELNAQCQSARLQAGVLGSDHIVVGDYQFRIGDVVLFRQTSRLYQVNNGSRGVVLGFNRLSGMLAVRLYATKKTVFIPYRTYTKIHLGYAMTTHKAQGATVPSVYVLLGGPMQDRHLSYVQTTRACESTRLYVDKCNAGPDLKHLFGQMAKERPKLLAHDIVSANTPSPTLEPPVSDDLPPPVAYGAEVLAEILKHVEEKKAASIAQPNNLEPGSAENSEPTADDATATFSGPDVPAVPLPTTCDEQNSKAEPDPATFDAQLPLNRPFIAGRLSDFYSVANKSPESTPPQLASLVHFKNHDATGPNIARPVPQPKATRAPRDVSDVSHVTVTGTTDARCLTVAAERYGKVPGGIVVEGEAQCEVPLNSIAVDPHRPTHLIINGSYQLDTGLSAEEVALIWHVVLGTGQAIQNFGVISQQAATGIDDDTLVAVTMMHADNALGRFGYGYDSTHDLWHQVNQSFRSPFISETELLAWPAHLERQFFNILHRIYPRFFLSVADVAYAASEGTLFVASTKVNAAFGVVASDGQVATALPKQPCFTSSVEARFPSCYAAFQRLVVHFGDFARTEPRIGRSLAYAELVCLLRRAKSAKAELFSNELMDQLVTKRERFPRQRLNFTLRSFSFWMRAKSTAERLCRTIDGNSFSSLINAIVGLEYARLAGDFDSFLTCKRAALACIPHLHAAPPPANDRDLQIFRMLPEIAQRVAEWCPDVLIDTCVHAALETGRTYAERSQYLNDALRHCRPIDTARQDPIAICRRLEVQGYLGYSFDPVPELLRTRRDHPSSLEPFLLLERLNRYREQQAYLYGTSEKTSSTLNRRKHELYPPFPPKADAELLKMVEAQLSDKSMLWLLEELQRFGVSLHDYLATVREHGHLHPLKCFSQHMATLLKSRRDTAFSPVFLHRDNPFVASQQLLDSEPPDQLAFLFAAARPKIEIFRALPRGEGFWEIHGPESVERWWQSFLKSHASDRSDEASKLVLLLAWDLVARGCDVTDLHHKMRQHRTGNPQAALFFLDLSRTNSEMLDWPR